GNWLVKDKSDIADAIKHFAGVDLYAEELIDLKQETAVIVARGKDGVVVYDPVDTVHVNNICHTVVAPSQADDKTQNKARKIALEVLEKLKGRGVFAIEMFITKEDKVLVNEIAPRVHNSGHHTIES